MRRMKKIKVNRSQISPRVKRVYVRGDNSNGHKVISRKPADLTFIITDELYANNESFVHTLKNARDKHKFLESLQERSIKEFRKAKESGYPIINMVFFGHWGWAFSQILKQYKDHAHEYEIVQSVKPIPGADVYQYWRGASNDMTAMFQSLGTFKHRHDFIAKGIDMFHDSPNDVNRSKIGIRMDRLRSFGGSFCTSMEQYEFLKNHKKIGKYHAYIPLGVRDDIITKSKHNEKGKIRIGFIGRAYYDGVKNESRLIEIAKLLDRNKFEFIILSPNIQHIVDKLKGMGFNVYQQNKKNFIELYRMIDVTLILSKYEGTPLPLIESMKFGHTVLSTDVGEASTLLGDTPYILNSNDEFARILNELETNRGILKANIKINSKKVSNRTWKSFVDKSIKLWKRLL